jgi:hypothetical protein
MAHHFAGLIVASPLLRMPSNTSDGALISTGFSVSKAVFFPEATGPRSWLAGQTTAARRTSTGAAAHRTSVSANKTLPFWCAFHFVIFFVCFPIVTSFFKRLF